QRICVKADTRGDVGASHEELDSLIKPPPPLEVPLDQEVVHHDTHLSHPAHPHLPCVPPAAPTSNGGSTTQAKVLLESFLASTRPSSVDLQLSRQLFQAPNNIQWKVGVFIHTAGINRSNTAVRAVLEQPCSTGGRTGTVRPKQEPTGRTDLSDRSRLVLCDRSQELIGQACPTRRQVLRSDSACPTTGRTRLFEHRSNCRSRVQHKIQDILMQHNLESYSQPQSIDGRIFVKSPLPLIKRYIIEQSAAFKREFLPLGLLIGNHEAMASVATFLQGMVKHKRTHLRNLLLTNTRQEQQAKEPGPVPRLMELLVLID
ncbi:hypothetical protein PCANC_24041, partial [Puccinia coronata f. sp. avenae]